MLRKKYIAGAGGRARASTIHLALSEPKAAFIYLTAAQRSQSKVLAAILNHEEVKAIKDYFATQKTHRWRMRSRVCLKISGTSYYFNQPDTERITVILLSEAIL